MYSYKTEDNTPHKRCKGIKKCVIDEITHEDYDRCLNDHEILHKSQNILHKVYTVQVDKIALSYNDDKCFIMDDNISTLTHGHYKIKSMF